MQIQEINTREAAEAAIRGLMKYIGEDPQREGLVGTPDRILRMWEEIFRGYKKEKKPKITTFSNDLKCEDLVFDTGDFYSMCEHHILPFFGHYYFAYIPKESGRIIGISKISRVISYCAARMQLQERLACDVIEMLQDAVGDCYGMAIMMRAQHLCKSMRGARNNGTMQVCKLTGVFKDNANLQREFYEMVKNAGK